MRERLIGIDAGGTMTKVRLFDLAGNELACERQPNVMLMPEQGWTERDAEGMWQAACLSIRSLLENTGTDPGDILAITPSGYGGGVYLVDREGNPVRNALVSTDTRCVPLIEEWNDSGLRQQVSALIEQQCGRGKPSPSWPDAGAMSLDTGAHAHVLSCKDFLRLRLCGDISTDHPRRLRRHLQCQPLRGFRGCLQADVAEGWLSKLPPVGPPTEVVGKVNAKAAAQTGLREGTPVVRGVFDVVGCSLATGVEHSQQLAGRRHLQHPFHAASQAAMNPMPHIQTPYPVAGQVLATTAMPTSASNLEWFCRPSWLRSRRKRVPKAAASTMSAMRWWRKIFSRPSRIQFFPFLY